MNNNNYLKDVQRRRRLKYGSFAVAITAAVIALVVAVNAIFTALAQKYMWYIDMTERDLYTPNESAMTLIEQFRGSENLDITFTFCMPEDQTVENEMVNMVSNLVKVYANEFDFISVEYVDIVNNPQILDKYQGTSLGKPKTTSVIVSNGNNALLFAIDTFFVSDDGNSSSIYAFRGDYVIASAVLRLAGDSPIAYFVTNHGEEVEGTALRELFIDAGYDVRNIDLQKEDPLPAAKVVVINNPKYDFWGPKDTVNEIKKLQALLDNTAGLMVFMDETTNPTPNLDLFLEDWGVRFERSFIRDTDNCLAGTLGLEIVAQYVTEGTGASLTSALREQSNPPKAIVSGCRPITLLYDDVTGKYFTDATRYASAVLTTSKTAVAKPLDDKDAEGVKGRYNVMTVTVDSRMKDNASQRSYLLAAGTTAFTDAKYIEGTNYANRDIIFNVMRQFAKRNVPMDIDPKIFANDTLSLTAAEANRWTVICTVVLPAAIAGIGIYVYARRRYL